ncbi:MAG: DUF4384 domain-containing protein [Pseudomonadota bacterium]
MIRAPLIWGAGLLASVALHAAAGTALLWSVEPDEVATQPVPETRMQLAAHRVKQSQATETQPKADTTPSQDASGPRLVQGAIRQSEATAIDAAALGTSVPDQTMAQSEPLNPVQNSQTQLASVEAAPLKLVSPGLNADVVDAANVTAQPVLLAQPDSPSAAAVEAQPIALTVTEPDVATATAADVFSAAGGGSIDPVSLAAFQSFMQPEDAGQGAADVRDGIDGLLSQVPCSRLQVQFRPETNTLDLIGHIPEDGLRNPVLAALQAQMGANIRVADNLLILPRPQCGALSGIADVGLPQSTDQITNPLLVGQDVHAREFTYTEGQQLVLDMTGADYDAYVYVDYFDADGQVIHLSPNASVPLTRTPAKSELRIGAQNPGDPGLFITIGPPYGQEIAVAFAASRPLYQQERPLTEPADAYLSFMKDRVAAARAEDPDFKGEWVYFFVTTAAR